MNKGVRKMKKVGPIGKKKNEDMDKSWEGEEINGTSRKIIRVVEEEKVGHYSPSEKGRGPGGRERVTYVRVVFSG